LPRRRLLYLHPPLDALGVARFPPPLQVEHHDPCVEVARVPAGESPGEPLVRPEPGSEVLREVGVAVLRRADGTAAEVGTPELGDVVDEDEVGVEVDDPAHAWLEQVGEVVARVVERLLQGLPHRRGDEPPDAVGVEVVNLEPEPREDGADEVPEARVGDEEVEEDTLGAPGVLHHRVHGGDGAPQVLLIERDRDVDEGGVADVGAVGGGAVGGGIAERRRAAEGDPSGAARDLAGEADAAVELRGPDGLGGREGLERRRQHHHQHGGGEEAGQARHPKHRAHPARPPLPCAGSPVSRRLLRPHRHAVQPRDGVGQVVGNTKGARPHGWHRLLNWIASRSPCWWRIGAWSGGEASANPCEARRGEWGWTGQLQEGEEAEAPHPPTHRDFSPFLVSASFPSPLRLGRVTVVVAATAAAAYCIRRCDAAASSVLFNFALQFWGIRSLSRPLLSSPGFEKREPSGVGEEKAASWRGWPGGRQRKTYG
jgi:hypothetical protein